jgi:hypothetical protein
LFNFREVFCGLGVRRNCRRKIIAPPSTVRFKTISPMGILGTSSSGQILVASRILYLIKNEPHTHEYATYSKSKSFSLEEGMICKEKVHVGYAPLSMAASKSER